MLGADAAAMGLGQPGPGALAARSPSYQPVPNAVPAGANTGAPPRTKFYSRLVIPASAVGAAGTNNVPTEIVPGTPENRIAYITAPSNSGTVYIGDASVTPQTGLPLVPGLPYPASLVGLQDLFAVTDAPTYVRVGVQVAIVLASEQARPVK